MIHTLTLNPAVDKILYLPKFQKNITNRLTGTEDTIGGKGTHVSITLSCLGVPSIAYGVAHGETGRHILDLMGQYPNIRNAFVVREGAESRVNYLLVEDSGDCCVLANHGVTLTDADIEDVIGRMADNVSDGDAVIISGDASNCPKPDIDNIILDRLSGHDLHFYLDASGKTLKNCLTSHPFLIKPNEDELSQIVGHELHGEDDIIMAIDSLEHYRIPVIAVSLGGDGSIVKYQDRLYRVRAPKVNVRNTIGCGDAYLSGLIYGFEQGRELTDVLKTATAISASAAESSLSVGFDLDRAKSLENDVTISQMR